MSIPSVYVMPINNEGFKLKSLSSTKPKRKNTKLSLLIETKRRHSRHYFVSYTFLFLYTRNWEYCSSLYIEDATILPSSCFPTEAKISSSTHNLWSEISKHCEPRLSPARLRSFRSSVISFLATFQRLDNFTLHFTRHLRYTPKCARRSQCLRIAGEPILEFLWKCYCRMLSIKVCLN